MCREAASSPPAQPGKPQFHVQFSSAAQSCPTLCGPMSRGPPGLPVHHQLPELTQVHVRRVESMMPSNHLVPHRPLLLPPSSFPSIRFNVSLHKIPIVRQPCRLPPPEAQKENSVLPGGRPVPPPSIPLAATVALLGGPPALPQGRTSSPLLALSAPHAGAGQQSPLAAGQAS